jgi:uncharacterized membrane protein YozB (DUF420 family)
LSSRALPAAVVAALLALAAAVEVEPAVLESQALGSTMLEVRSPVPELVGVGVAALRAAASVMASGSVVGEATGAVIERARRSCHRRVMLASARSTFAGGFASD